MSRTARNKRHMVASIEGTLAALRRGEDTALALLDMHDFAQAIKDVEAMKDDGYEVIPSENCDNQAYDGSCLGHKTWVDDSASRQGAE